MEKRIVRFKTWRFEIMYILLLINIIFVPVLWIFAMGSFENGNYRIGYFELFLCVFNAAAAIYHLSYIIT